MSREEWIEAVNVELTRECGRVTQITDEEAAHYGAWAPNDAAMAVIDERSNMLLLERFGVGRR